MILIFESVVFSGPSVMRIDVGCRFSLYEPVEFIRLFLADKLEWRKVKDSIAIHVPCSSKKMGISTSFEELAARCANEVTPSGIPCCGKKLTSVEGFFFFLGGGGVGRRGVC
jgi:hypothetical protein